MCDKMIYDGFIEETQIKSARQGEHEKCNEEKSKNITKAREREAEK